MKVSGRFCCFIDGSGPEWSKVLGGWRNRCSTINCKQAAHHVMALAHPPGSNQIMKHGSIIGIP